jgi:glycosyltransferase involved in cell wall biosynthesis
VTPPSKIAIVGSVGLPARYGGFETLVDALVTAADARRQANTLTVYCSRRQLPPPRPKRYLGARLVYLPFRANGVQSIPYDALALVHAALTRHRTILVLGTSGALAIPLLRLFSSARLVVHPDGIEWARPKWSGLAKRYLAWAERIAVTWAHDVISDNPAISTHLRDSYGIEPVDIAYGGDQAVAVTPADLAEFDLPEGYGLSLARIEPENNIEVILRAFADCPDQPLVIVGNWATSAWAQALRSRYARYRHLHLLDAVYDPGMLAALRRGARFYVHGHSAGGTNPALVEMMHVGRPIAAFDCAFNRTTTDGAAYYFDDADSLRRLFPTLTAAEAKAAADRLQQIAEDRYRWSEITERYFDLLGLPRRPAPMAPSPDPEGNL